MTRDGDEQRARWFFERCHAVHGGDAGHAEDCKFLADQFAAVRAEAVAAERARCAGAIVMLRDRIFASSTFAYSVGADEPDSQHESAVDVVHRNALAIQATDDLDDTDRSHERWELEASGRLAAAIRRGE